jgi:hypothetical protein
VVLGLRPLYPGELVDKLGEWLRSGVRGGWVVRGIPGWFVAGYSEDLSLNGLAGFLAGVWSGRPAVSVWLRPSRVAGLEYMPSPDIVSQWAGLVEGLWRLERDWSSAGGVESLESFEAGEEFYLVASLRDPGEAGRMLSTARERLACLKPPHDIDEIVYGNTRISREEAITVLFLAANSLAFDVLFLIEELESGQERPPRGLDDAGFVPLDDFHEIVGDVHEVSRSTVYRLLEALVKEGYLVHEKGKGYMLNLRSGAGYVLLHEIVEEVGEESILCALKPFLYGYTHMEWLLGIGSCSGVNKIMRGIPAPRWSQVVRPC